MRTAAEREGGRGDDGNGGSGDGGGCGIVAVPVVSAPAFRCDKCFQSGVTYVAKNANGLNMHVRSVHGIRNPIESLVDSPLCPVCKGWYHTRIHLIKHLATASKSKHDLLACGQKFMLMSPALTPIAPKVLEKLRAQDRQLRLIYKKLGNRSLLPLLLIRLASLCCITEKLS